MQWENQEHEETLFRICRVASWYDFAKTLEHCMGGPKLVELCNSLFSSNFKPWLKLNALERNNVISFASVSLMYDPAVDLGFPEVSEKDKEASLKVLKAIGGKKGKHLEKRVAKYIKAVNKEANEVIEQVNEASLCELSEMVDQALHSRQKRWRLFWALATDRKTTRLNELKRLKYTDPEEVEQEFSFIMKHRDKIGKLNEGWEAELELDVELARRALIQYRAYRQGVCFDEEFYYQQIIADLEEELEIYSQSTGNLYSRIGEMESQLGKIPELKKELEVKESQKSGLEQQIKVLELKIESARQPAEVKSPEQEELDYARQKLKEAEEEKGRLSSMVAGSESKINQLEDEAGQREKTIQNFRGLVELASIRELMRDYFVDKKVLVVKRQKGDDEKYQRAVEQFCPSVEVINPSLNSSASEKLASSSYTHALLITGSLTHEETNSVEPGKRIILPGKDVSRIPGVMLAAIPPHYKER